jgi:hypothetical protein
MADLAVKFEDAGFVYAKSAFLLPKWQKTCNQSLTGAVQSPN